jgi:hypothetical protein
MSERLDEGPVLGAPGLHSFMVFLFIIGTIVLLGTMRDPAARPIGLIAFGVGLFAVTIAGLRFWRLRRALGTADLRLEDPVPLGFSGTATYFRPLRGAELRSIDARLQCEEKIVKGSGKNRHAVKKIVHDEVLTASVVPMMERIEVRIPIKIPVAGPPTMELTDASTTWRLRLRLEMNGCPNTASAFEIEVLPGVARL